MVAESFANTLGSLHDVVGIAGGRTDALRLADAYHPEVILLDIVLGPENGFELVPELRERAPGAAIVVVTQYNSSDFQSVARELGAEGFLAKSEPWSVVFEAIAVVANGGTWYSKPKEELAYVASRLKPSIHLTTRQIEVLENVDRGLTYKEIGKAMILSENTIDVYLRRIRHVLGAHNAVDLVRLARQHGFLPHPAKAQRPAHS